MSQHLDFPFLLYVLFCFDLDVFPLQVNLQWVWTPDGDLKTMMLDDDDDVFSRSLDCKTNPTILFHYLSRRVCFGSGVCA